MKLKWQKCPCGHELCNLAYPTNLGRFYQGTGFRPDERELLDRAFDALEKWETYYKDLPYGTE